MKAPEFNFRSIKPINLDALSEALNKEQSLSINIEAEVHRIKELMNASEKKGQCAKLKETSNLLSKVRHDVKDLHISNQNIAIKTSLGAAVGMGIIGLTQATLLTKLAGYAAIGAISYGTYRYLSQKSSVPVLQNILKELQEVK